MRKMIFILLSIVTFSYGCDKPEPPTLEEEKEYDRGFIVIEEGNFNWGNTSISYIPGNASLMVENDIYKLTNPDKILGDVAHSAASIGNEKIGLVINNSGKIEIVDGKTFKQIGSISGLGSPRELVSYQNKAFVSDLYDNKINIVDLTTNTISGSIPVNGWSEEMVKFHSHLYVLVRTHPLFGMTEVSEVVVIDMIDNSIVKIYDTHANPVGMTMCDNDGIFVLCAGDEALGELPAVHIMKGTSSISGGFYRSGYLEDYSIKPSLLGVNITRSDYSNYIYWKDETNNVFRTDIERQGDIEDNFKDSEIFKTEGETIYNISIAKSGVFIADAIDYQQNGIIRIYYENGDKAGEYNVGVNPGYIYYNFL